MILSFHCLVVFVVIYFDLVFLLLSSKSLDFGTASSVLLFVVMLQASQEDAIKQKELLVNELKCIRVELQQVREDRDRQVTQVQALTADVEKYKEFSGKSAAELDNLTLKTNALEVCC